MPLWTARENSSLLGLANDQNAQNAEDLQGRLRDVEARLAIRRAQHPKQVAEIAEEISAALPKTEAGVTGVQWNGDERCLKGTQRA